MFQTIRAWWTKRQKCQQEKYAKDHAWVDPADLAQAQRNFDPGTRREGGGR